MKYAYAALVAAVSAETKPLEWTQNYTYNSTNANVTSNTYSNPDTKTMISEMRHKYNDFFAYSMDLKNVTNDEATGLIAECSTTQECSDSNEMT